MEKYVILLIVFLCILIVAIGLLIWSLNLSLKQEESFEGLIIFLIIGFIIVFTLPIFLGLIKILLLYY